MDAWFYSRTFWYELGLSVSSGQNRSGIHTGWWFYKPTGNENNPQDRTKGARWDYDPSAAGTFLQDFVSGTGNRPLWFDYTDPTGLRIPAKGPFGAVSMREHFKRALLDKVLSQSKPRIKAVALINGEPNRLLLRVPHK